MTQASDLVPIENQLPVMAPAQVLNQAKEAAQALQGVIKNKAKPVIMPNGEQYLEFEDWQTLARFYGYTVETGESEEIWRDGTLVGYKAKATVYCQGNKVGGAEGSCMRDEKTWAAKPEFQLKSMAQTRAGAKALRNVLAWVAVLAGFKPTPAEEMQEVFPVKDEKAEAKEWAKKTFPRCEECGQSVNDAVRDYSVKNFGKVLCYNDQLPYKTKQLGSKSDLEQSENTV